MSVHRWRALGPDGRIAGAYVYLLLCRDEERIYIKVGQTTRPEERFHELKNGCPVTPRSFSVIPVPGPVFSKRLEASLHGAFKEWRVAGEWFAMDVADKREFNNKLQLTLTGHSIPLWRMSITKVSAAYLIQLAEKRRLFWKSQFKKNGRAYQDFCRAGGTR
jgi:hypothetical protein